MVILNWNGIDHLKTYLPSVLAHTPHDVAIWVADNGSSDDSVAWLTTTHADRVHVLELGENFGFAAGYNRALAQIDAEVYVLLNSDVRIVESWIEPTLSVMDAHGWDVASPLIAQDVNPDLCEHAGAAGGFMDRDGFPFCAGRMFDSVEPVDAWLARDREVFWASGACFFIRKHAWSKARGFDPTLFAHMEEIDLCWRLKNQGHKIGCAGQVKVHHLGGTLNTSSPFKTYLNFRNNLIILLKNKRNGPCSCSEEWPWMDSRRGACCSKARAIRGRRPRGRRRLFAGVFVVVRTPSSEGGTCVLTQCGRVGAKKRHLGTVWTRNQTRSRLGFTPDPLTSVN